MTDSVSAYTPHATILIDGNGQFTAANGVTAGTGLQSDPYIIEGWEINASKAEGIEIRNTDVFFIIRNVLIHSGANWSLIQHDGIHLVGIENGWVEDSVLLYNVNGIYMLYANSTTITGSFATRNIQNGIFASFSFNATISNNNVSTNLLKGVLLSGCDNATVSGNHVAGHEHGIEVASSRRPSVNDNTALNNTGGIVVSGSREAYIAGNILTDNEDGLLVTLSDFSTISGNTASMNNNTGFGLTSSDGVSISGNRALSNGLFGMHILSMTNSPITSNTISWNDYCGLFLIVSDFLSLNQNDISSNNDYGLCSLYANNITITDNTISSNLEDGVILTYSNDTQIFSNDVISNDHNGINLNVTSHANVVENTISANGWDGVKLRYSTGINLQGNAIPNNDYGIRLVSSNDNIIQANTIANSNYVGLVLDVSLGNTIYHNNILTNLQQASDNTNANQWDDGYPSGGNYWSDYSGIDQHSGPNQDLPGSDSIGDTPYVIDIDSRDRYPFTSPYLADAFPPVVWIDYPTEGQIFDLTPANVLGNATDIGGGSIQRVEVRVEGGPWSLATGTDAWTSSTNLNPGSNLIEARALDNSGVYSQTAGVTVFYSLPGNDPPVASFNVTPDSGLVSTVFTVNASSSHDVEDDVALLEVRWDWEDDGIWDTTWSTNKTDEHQYTSTGTYVIRLEVRDTGGIVNNTTRSVSVTPSSQPPEENKRPFCKITAPVEDEIVSGIYTIAGTASDSDGSVKKVEIRIDAGAWIEVDGKTSWSYGWNTKDHSDGSHKIYARAFDGEDFSQTVMVEVTVHNPGAEEPFGDWVLWIFGLIILLIIVITLIALFLLRRRKKEEEEEPSEIVSEEEGLKEEEMPGGEESSDDEVSE